VRSGFAAVRSVFAAAEAAGLDGREAGAIGELDARRRRRKRTLLSIVTDNRRRIDLAVGVVDGHHLLPRQQ
jgi:hypothetical protein